MDQTVLLVRTLRDQGPDAGQMLDACFREAMVRFCWGYLGSVDAAEDAVQEVWCKVLEATEVPDYFRPWLYRIARNHCLNVLRRENRARDRGALHSPSQVDAALTGHLTRLVRDEEKARVLQLVGKLTEEQREVLRLRYVEDLPRSEVADVLELPESVVKSRLFEGLKQLREFASAMDEPSN